MTVLALGHPGLLAGEAVALLTLSHTELLATVTAVGLLPGKAVHLRSAHLRGREARASATVPVTATAATHAHKRRRAAATAVTMAAAAREGRSTAAPVRSTTATVRAAASAAAGECGLAAAAAMGSAPTTAVGAAAAARLRATTATVRVAMLFTATAVAATGTCIGRGCDCQRGNARGKKDPGQHEKSPFERVKRLVRCTVPTPKRMELAL
jgi:hypothetical protein